MTLTTTEIERLLADATPGPWRADGEPWNRIVWSSHENRVCFMAHSNGLNDAKDIANARLIAAAPEVFRLAIDQARELAAANARIAELERVAHKTKAADNLREVYHRLPNEKAKIGDSKSAKSRARDSWLRAFNRAATAARAALKEQPK